MLNPLFDEPKTIKIVAVISNATPRVKKTRILRRRIFFLCSVIIAIEYESKAKTTMVVPICSSGFITGLLFISCPKVDVFQRNAKYDIEVF